jgi:isochorismate synthase EntC
MAIETASASSLGLMTQIQDESWLDNFLASGCVLASDDGRVWVGWGNIRSSEKPDPSLLSLFAPDFLLADPRPWRLFESSELMSLRDLIARLDACPERDKAIEWNEPSFERFVGVFKDIQEHIASADLSKAVPVISRQAAIRVGPTMRARAIRNALKAAEGSPLLPYGFWDGDEGIIGATPELLFDQQTPRDLETMALAGTRRQDGQGISLLTDPKEVFEHQVVVDGIVERLSPFGEVNVEETHEIRLPALIHLHTGIGVHARRDFEFADWVGALHPTPAIGAWPRDPGWRWLCAQSDSTTRRRFGAPFGLIPPGQTSGRCLVAIRNLQWDASHAWISAGSGIVAASRLEREWSELNSKLDSVQEALGI